MIALLKLTVVFAGIVLFLSRKWNLGLVLLLASFAVGLLFAYPLPDIGRDVFLASVDPLTLGLALAVVLIMTLGELLRQGAGLERMVEALQSLISSGRVVMAALPALIGFLPMIGGAMFSAPMVDEVGKRLGVDQEHKTFVNYWFRHIWEYVFPLYPSVILAAVLMGMTTPQLMRATWPLTVAALVGGSLFGLLSLPRHGAAPPRSASRAQNLRALAETVWPIVLVIALSLTFPVDERLALILSLLATITVLMLVKRIPPRVLMTILRERIPWKTVVVVFGALIFRRVLDNSGAIGATLETLTDMHIPLVAITFIVPFIAGLLTGWATAAVSIGFPVVVPLVAADGGAVAPEWAAWLMAASFLGVLLSPVHLCLALTRVYFQARWGPLYRLIAPSTLVVAATAAVMLWLA